MLLVSPNLHLEGRRGLVSILKLEKTFKPYSNPSSPIPYPITKSPDLPYYILPPSMKQVSWEGSEAQHIQGMAEFRNWILGFGFWGFGLRISGLGFGIAIRGSGLVALMFLDFGFRNWA